jgi:hypothetical protein
MIVRSDRVQAAANTAKLQGITSDLLEAWTKQSKVRSGDTFDDGWRALHHVRWHLIALLHCMCGSLSAGLLSGLFVCYWCIAVIHAGLVAGG